MQEKQGVGSPFEAAASQHVGARAWAALARGLRWRGEDGLGLPIGAWLSVLGVAWVSSLLFLPLEPALILLPPMLTLAIFVPVAQSVFAANIGTAADAKRRSWFEMPTVCLLLGAVGWGVFGHAWRRGMLIDSGDHQFMMGRAEIFYDGLRHGHWQHWTHLWQAGDTITDLYPIEANLITALIHAFAPRGTPFVASYTVFVLWAWWLRGVGVYYLARRFSSPLIAFALAYAALFDVGKDINGGVWFGALFFGMIHNALAISVGLFASALAVDLARKVSGPRFVWCSVLTALSACGHALGMLVMVVSTAAFALALLLGQARRREAAWALAALCLGLALAAVWILPFTHSLAQSNFRVATSGANYGELGQGILDGSLPTSSFAGFLGLWVAAAIVACFTLEIPLVAAGVTSILLILLVLTQFLVGSRFFAYAPAFLDSQPYRMLTVFKTSAVPCVAWLAQTIWKRVPAPSRSLRFSRVIRRAVLASLLLYGLGRSFALAADHLGIDLRAQVPHLSAEIDRSHTGADYRAIFGWLKEQRQADPSSTPWRAAILWRTTWRHAAWSEGMNTGVPIVDPSQVPSNFFEIRPREVNARALSDWAVRYVLTDYASAPFSGTTKRFSSGNFHIWEVDAYDGRYIVAPSGVTVSHLELTGESIRFEVDGAPAAGVDLQLRTAAYPRWRARQNGEWLPVSARLPRADSKPKQEQLVIHAGNGQVLATCDGTLPRFWPGLTVSLGALLAIALAASAKRRARVEHFCKKFVARAARGVGEAYRHRSPRTLGWLAALASLVLIGTGVMVRIRGSRSLAPAAFEGLSDLSVRWHTSDGRSGVCLPMPWFGRYACSNDGAMVDNWLGTTGPGDDSGEFAALWPGVRVTTRDATSTTTLRFGRIRLDAPRGLWLQTAESGGHHLKVTWGELVLADFDANGEELHRFAIPRGQPSSRPLEIEVQGAGGSSLVFRGGGGPAPAFR